MHAVILPSVFRYLPVYRVNITDTLAHNPCMHRVKTAIILLADDAKECC
jgi:hypothetical protein